jgi:hypothetical protein
VPKTHSKYRGSLARTRADVRPNHDLLETDEERRSKVTAWAAGQVEADLRGLGLLMEHYGINPQDKDAFLWLSLKLARDHVPYFKIEGAGRKGTDPMEHVRLIRLVERERRRGHSINRACQLIQQRGDFVEIKDLPRKYRDATKSDVAKLAVIIAGGTEILLDLEMDGS